MNKNTSDECLSLYIEEFMTGSIRQRNGKIGGHEFVDLGLPSGNLWATCNLGADVLYESGDYLPFDDSKLIESVEEQLRIRFELPEDSIERKELRVPDTIIIPDVYNSSDTNETDPVTLSWGKDWKTPEYKDFQELLDFCKWDWCILSDRIPGCVFYNPDDNSRMIFLPYMNRNPKIFKEESDAIRSYNESYYREMEAHYLTSSIVYRSSRFHDNNNNWRKELCWNAKSGTPQLKRSSYIPIKFNIRPVAVKRGSIYKLCQIDLGNDSIQ